MTDISSAVMVRLLQLEARIQRLESALVPSTIEEETLTHIKALIKSGSNSWFNGMRDNPHRTGTREHELWQYGADLAHDVSVES
jgi:hypothetical protein